MFLGMYACFFMGALYLEHVRGYGALDTGVAFLPMTLVVAIPLNRASRQRLVGRFGPKRVLLPALCCVIAGLLALTKWRSTAGYSADVHPPFLLVGRGDGAGVGAAADDRHGERGRPAMRGSRRGSSMSRCRSRARLGVAVLGRSPTDCTNQNAGLAGPDRW